MTGITPCIPGRKSRNNTIKYDKRRNRIEIMFGHLKDWRRVATRYDRRPMAFICAIASRCDRHLLALINESSLYVAEILRDRSLGVVTMDVSTATEV